MKKGERRKRATSAPREGRHVHRQIGGAPRENRSMILQAGPLLISFLMFEEITAFCDLVPSEFVLYLALAGLLLSLFLDFRPR